jgi:hypothetical protein
LRCREVIKINPHLGIVSAKSFFISEMVMLFFFLAFYALYYRASPSVFFVLQLEKYFSSPFSQFIRFESTVLLDVSPVMLAMVRVIMNVIMKSVLGTMEIVLQKVFYFLNSIFKNKNEF